MTVGAMNRVRDALRTRLWPLPAAAVAIALVLGLVVPRADAHIDDALPRWLSDVLFGGDPGAARTVLDAVASSLITVTSLTFSLTVVTLQLASSQFSPRLLRTFTSDVFVQATLGLFLATFTFSLTVLRSVRSVRSANDAQSAFVPRISVTMSFLLATASVLGLVVFLAHLARQIRVETMLREVHHDATETIAAVVVRDDRAQPNGHERLPQPPLHAVRLFARSSGFLVQIDEEALCRCAINNDVHVVLECHPGASLVSGTPIGWVWSPSGPLRDGPADAVQTGVAKAMRVGFERTAAQDVGYGLRQLTDVANKALSPGINDPTTAIHALAHISALLCELANCRLGAVVVRDHDGLSRVVLHRPDLAELVDAAISQPRRYGSSDVQVLTRLFGLLEELAWHVHARDNHIVLTQLTRLQGTVEEQDLDAYETVQLSYAGHRVTAALAERGLTDGSST